MGGQACVFYRAAQVRKDLDLTRLTEPANLERLRVALKQLAAQRIAVQELRHNKTSQYGRVQSEDLKIASASNVLHSKPALPFKV